MFPNLRNNLACRAALVEFAMTGRRGRSIVLSICLLAFALRVGVGWFGPDHFWAYMEYLQMATVLAHGGGYCLGSDGTLCAYFPPVYPTLLAACVLTGHTKVAMTLLGSGLGSGTVYLTFIIGRRIRGPLVGLLACLYAAVYPYYVWHDAVLQETATLTFVVACALLMLIRSNSDTSRWTQLGAGCALGLTVLTKANLLLYVPLAIGWAFLAAPGGWPRRIRPALWLTLGVVLTLSPWMIRTWHIAGAPIIYSNGGFSLWTSNHRLTFVYFPRLSIDAASEPEWNDMTAAERNEYDAIRDPQGIDQTLWLWHKGMTYIRSHPGQTFLRSLYKVWIAFSPVFSPAKGGAFQMAYAIFYLPLFAFSGIGLWLTRRRWRDTGYFLLLVPSFALCSAVLWGHTSHRMYLEPYLMVLSACVVQEFCLTANAKRSTPEGFEPFWQKAGLDD